jgi:hypothetical protein
LENKQSKSELATLGKPSFINLSRSCKLLDGCGPTTFANLTIDTKEFSNMIQSQHITIKD